MMETVNTEYLSQQVKLGTPHSFQVLLQPSKLSTLYS